MSKSRSPPSAPVADDPRTAPYADTSDPGGQPLTVPWKKEGNTHIARFLQLRVGEETEDKLRALSPTEREERVARMVRWRPEKVIPHDKPTMGRIFAEDLRVILALLDGDKSSLIGSRGPTIHETADPDFQEKVLRGAVARVNAGELDSPGVKVTATVHPSPLRAKPCPKCHMPEPGWTEGSPPPGPSEMNGCGACGKRYWRVPPPGSLPNGADWLDPSKHPPVEPITVGGPTGDLKPELARKTYPPSNPRHPEHQIWLEQEARRRKKSVSVLKAAEERRRKEQAAKKGEN